jgi:polyketide synthase PksJ
MLLTLTVHVVDSDGRLVPVGVPSELLAGGDGVACGYIGQPEMTKQSFLLDTFSQTATSPTLPLKSGQ